MPPDVSVVVPCYNGASFIERAIDSTMDELGCTFEVIVVDDGSTDCTSRILSHYGDRIRVLRKENAGVSAARNDGLALAAGRFIRFLDADDVLTEGSLAKMVAMADRFPGTACVGRATTFRDDRAGMEKPLYDIPFQGSSGSLVPAGRLLCQPVQVGLMLLPRTAILEGFALGRRFGEEFAFLRGLISSGLEFRFIDQPVLSVRVHDGPRLSRRADELDHRKQCEEIALSAAQILEAPERDAVACQRLGTFCWARARDCFRMGLPDTAEGYLRLARTLGGKELVAGTDLYKALVPVFGPRRTEGVLEAAKSLRSRVSNTRWNG